MCARAGALMTGDSLLIQDFSSDTRSLRHSLSRAQDSSVKSDRLLRSVINDMLSSERDSGVVNSTLRTLGGSCLQNNLQASGFRNRGAITAGRELAALHAFARMSAEWAGSSVGRAPRSQRGGRGFESPLVHHSFSFSWLCASCKNTSENFSFALSRQNHSLPHLK